MRYKVKSLELNPSQYEITNNGTPVAVEPKVFDLILYLIEHRERLISRDELFENIWQGRTVSDTSLSNHIKSARKTLGDDGEQQQVIKTIRGRGYQFVAPVTIEKNSSHFSQPTQKPKPHRLYQSVIAILVTAIIALILYKFPLSNAPIESPERLAVIPFKNLDINTESDYLGLALADQVIGRLAYVNQLSVKASGSVQQYQQQDTSAKSIGEILNVDYVLMGSYLSLEETIKLNLELINVHTNELLWRETLTEKTEDIFQLQEAVARKVGKFLEVHFSPSAQLSKRYAKNVNPLAYQYYLRAIAQPYSNEGAKKALILLNKAVAMETEFAPIFTELAIRTKFLAIFSLAHSSETDQAIQYFKQALALHPNSKKALSGLAGTYVEIGKTIEAAELTHQLIKQNPNDAQAYYALGYLYRYAGMLNESIKAMEMAIAIEPLSGWSHNLGVTYFSAQQYDEALAALAVGDKTMYSMAWTSTVFIHQDKQEEAIALLDQVIAMKPGDFWEYDSRAFKAAVRQDTEEGLRLMKKLEAANVIDCEPLFYWGALYAEFGDKKGAMRMLKSAVKQGYFNYPLFQSLPYLNSLRETPEFNALLKQVEHKHTSFKKVYRDKFGEL